MKYLLFFLFLFVACNNSNSDLWPGGEIPFIMVGLSLKETDMALSAMVDWQVRVFLLGGKIHFHLAKKSDDKKLTIIHKDLKNSPEGYIPKLRILMISYQSDTDNRWVRHGMGHVLGLLHEHQRIDRDLYISIFLNGDETPAELLQFIPLKSDDYNMTEYPYDYNSIMHYNKSELCDIGTIEKINDPSFQLGSDEISFLDAQKVADMYPNKHSAIFSNLLK